MLILIEVPERRRGTGTWMTQIERMLGDDASVEIDPSVYVVDYGSVENGPAVFARREDAEAFADDRTEAVVERVTIADAATAKIMMEDDSDPEQEACDSACPHCGRQTAETCNCMEPRECASCGVDIGEYEPGLTSCVACEEEK